VPKFVADKASINLTISNFQGTRAAARAAAAAAVGLAGNKLLVAVRQNVSAPALGGNAKDHARALAAMDHPYARRHPQIQYSAKGGSPGFAARQLVVHTVSGDLLRAIRGVFDPRTLEYRVATDASTAPHVDYVIQGTRVMHPRDIITATANDPTVRRDMLRTIVDVFGKAFRSKASLRFV
jgi:hypothetical protein